MNTEYREGLMNTADISARRTAWRSLESWGVVLPRGTRWRNLSPRQRRAILARSAIQLGLLAVALTDLRSRDREQVRGPKLVWAAVCCANYLGAGPLLYLLFGRRLPAMKDMSL
jgi:hypothetical protein